MMCVACLDSDDKRQVLMAFYPKGAEGKSLLLRGVLVFWHLHCFLSSVSRRRIFWDGDSTGVNKRSVVCRFGLY
jgi:hypothetical protein